MNQLRRYLFPLFTVCAALAVGIALGAGPLQGASGERFGEVRADNTALSDRVTALEAARVFGESVSQAAAVDWLDGRLTGTSVTIVVLPGVDEERVTSLQKSIEAGGGATAVTARIAPTLVDSAKKTYVDSVASSSLQGIHDLGRLPAEETYTRISALVARAYVGSGDVVTLDDEANKIDSELQGAKLVSVDGSPARRGTLVVVLAPGDHGGDVDTEATHVIETALVAALARASSGAVLATPPTGASPGGLIAAVQAEPGLVELPLSTLNVSTGIAADVAAVYALRAAAAGKSGSFGVDGSDVTLPPGLAPVTS